MSASQQGDRPKNSWLNYLPPFFNAPIPAGAIFIFFEKMVDAGRQYDIMYLPHHGAGFAMISVGLSPPISSFLAFCGCGAFTVSCRYQQIMGWIDAKKRFFLHFVEFWCILYALRAWKVNCETPWKRGYRQTHRNRETGLKFQIKIPVSPF
jgi:hypothetical protein